MLARVFSPGLSSEVLGLSALHESGDKTPPLEFLPPFPLPLPLPRCRRLSLEDRESSSTYQPPTLITVRGVPLFALHPPPQHGACVRLNAKYFMHIYII